MERLESCLRHHRRADPTARAQNNMNRTNRLSLVVVLLLAAASAFALGASDGASPPPAVTPIPATPTASGDGEAATPSPTTIVPSTSRTVQLLLQLQGNVVPNGSDARAPDVNAAAAQETQRKQAREALFANRSPLGDGLDGKAAAKPSVALPPPVSWSGNAGADADTGGGSGSSFSSSYSAPRGGSDFRSDDADSGGGRVTMNIVPLSVIRFVRRNRELVIGAAVLVLVLIGIGAGSATKRG